MIEPRSSPDGPPVPEAPTLATATLEVVRLLAAGQIHGNRLLFNANICDLRKSRTTGA
jgi:hypothetical protein